MNDTDRYFTEQIVGSPWETTLGEPVNLPFYRKNGIEVNLHTGEGRLDHLKSWLLVPSAYERAMVPHPYVPGLRERLHSLSLLIGLAGVVFGFGVGLWAWAAWR